MAVLRMNALAGTAVFQLDLRELQTLMGVSPFHRVAVKTDGAVVGYILAFSSGHGYQGEEFLVFRSALKKPFLYVDQIVIESPYRGIGGRRMLYEAITSRAHHCGANALCCEVNLSPPNPQSMDFHRTLGFRQIGAFETGDGRKVALLRKDINA